MSQEILHQRSAVNATVIYKISGTLAVKTIQQRKGFCNIIIPTRIILFGGLERKSQGASGRKITGSVGEDSAGTE